MISEKINRWISEYKAEGRAEGRAEGIEKGRAEGIEKGRAEGIIILLKEHLLHNRLSKEEVRADIKKLQKRGYLTG